MRNYNEQRCISCNGTKMRKVILTIFIWLGTCVVFLENLDLGYKRKGFKVPKNWKKYGLSKFYHKDLIKELSAFTKNPEKLKERCKYGLSRTYHKDLISEFSIFMKDPYEIKEKWFIMRENSVYCNKSKPVFRRSEVHMLWTYPRNYKKRDAVK